MRLTTEGLFIKISGITTEEDALFSVGLGASAVGFDFALGRRQISVERRTTSCVASLGRVSVGVFRNEFPQRMWRLPTRLAYRRAD